MPDLTWKRTGSITMRAEPYLIMRLPGNPQYLALYGPQTARSTIGRYDTATDAQKACQEHSDAAGDADNGQEKAPAVCSRSGRKRREALGEIGL